MKGYVPHQQPMVSNEPLPITRTIEISEGISVKELAEKLEIRAKDLITRLLMRGMFATSTRRSIRTRNRDGPPLRRRHQRHQL